MLSNAPISFKVALQVLTVQFKMEAELVAAALTLKKAVFCSYMMLELGFKESFGSAPLYIDNTSALQVAGNGTYNPHAQHIALRYLGTKHLSKDHHRDLIKQINEF